MIETYRGVVYPNQLDHMDHMNVQWYAEKFDQATWHLFSAVGITNTYIREKNRGMAALEQTTKYKREMVAGSLLQIRSRIVAVGEKNIRFLHVMVDTETRSEVATSELLAVHIDREKRKSCILPQEIRVKCEELISP